MPRAESCTLRCTEASGCGSSSTLSNEARFGSIATPTSLPDQPACEFMEGRSIFHALQVNLTRNMDHGLFFAINYIWSHAILRRFSGRGRSGYSGERSLLPLRALQ